MDKKTVKTMLVVGSEVMGNSIAQVFAGAGIAVRLMDVNEKALKRAMSLIESGLNTMADFGKISRDKIPSILSRITPSTDLAEMAGGADFNGLDLVSNIAKSIGRDSSFFDKMAERGVSESKHRKAFTIMGGAVSQRS